MATNDPNPFQSIPWISTLLEDTSFVTLTIPSRTNKSSTEDSLFSKTLNSETTLSACLSQYRAPRNTKSKSTPSSPQSTTTSTLAEELRLFFILGSDLNGYPGILHGGIVAALLDEATGLLLSLNGHVGDASIREAKDAQPGPVTAYLNTKFLRPVPTPGAILVQARMIEVKEDRKWRIEGVIRDGEGVVLAQAEALYIRPRAKI
jgi:acyl-coenzyme A thioesterase PaaI-like protein